MLINKKMRMADLIHQNYEVLTVIRRFDIELGFADKTIEEVCSNYKINTDFFVEIVNSFNNETYFSEKILKQYEVRDILFYLKSTHQYYLSKQIPDIEARIKELEFSDNNKKNKALIENFFNEYKEEFIKHVQREEERIYPYIIELDRALKTRKAKQIFNHSINEYSIFEYQQEHEDVEAKLYDLKNIIIKYLPSPLNPEGYNAILVKLFKLENDLNEHSRIEEKVIIPKVKEMEKEYHNAVASNKMEIV